MKADLIKFVLFVVLMLSAFGFGFFKIQTDAQQEAARKADCTKVCEPYQWQTRQDVCICKNIENKWVFKKDYLSIPTEKESE
tara:strand:+ start:2485 stop:2730 length:246 start_codon:yes stop_codon:yes gene_type:complete